jgi:hypothetical protein
MDIRALRRAAMRLDPELLTEAPDAYEEAFLNPCWQSAVAKSLRCLPVSPALPQDGPHCGTSSSTGW